jgi:hypothetical protein
MRAIDPTAMIETVGVRLTVEVEDPGRADEQKPDQVVERAVDGCRDDSHKRLLDKLGIGEEQGGNSRTCVLNSTVLTRAKVCEEKRGPFRRPSLNQSLSRWFETIHEVDHRDNLCGHDARIQESEKRFLA